ncbi:UNVERIFIED_CONTAM: hypothetical protein HDU68_003303, partial [Siphonaria sp. JEL0065]
SAPEEPEDEVDFGSEEEKALLAAALSEVDRYLALDRLNASHHNIVTRTCIESKMKWMLAGLVPVDLAFFLGFSGYGNFFAVRMAAIDSLLLLDGLYTEEITNYLLQVVEQDVDSRVACHTAKELYSFVVLAKSVSLDESRKKKSRNAVPKHDWASICSKISKNTFFTKLIWSLLKSSSLDGRIRSYLLKFCEVVYKPVLYQTAVAPRKLVIKMPSLSITEVPDAIPAPPKSASKSSAPKTPAPRPPPKAPVFTEPFPPIDPKFLETGRKVMMNITNHPSAAAFMLPVDESFAPMYFSLIKKPMDISTSSKKLEAGAYRNNLTFLFADIQLIFSNCYKYNTDDSPVTKQAQKLEHYFNTEIMPRALVHELNILSNAIDIEDDSISVAPTDMMEDVTPTPALAKPKLVIPAPQPKPVNTTPAIKPIILKPPAPEKAATTSAPLPPPPKLTLHPPKLVLTTGSASPPQPKVSPPLPPKPTPPKPAPVDPVPTQVNSTPTTVVAKPALAPIPSKSGSPLLPKALPPPSARPPPSKVLPSAGSSSATPVNLTPPLPKPVLKLKPDLPTTVSDANTSNSAPKRKLSVGGVATPPAVGTVPARLDSEDYKKCKKIIRHITEVQEKSFWFLSPVDPIALGIPTYFDVIKEPMDLTTLKTLLTDSKIVTVREFKNTAALIFKNAMAFNPPTTQVYQDAAFLLDMLKSEVRQYFGDSSKSESRSNAVPKPPPPQPVAAPVRPPQPVVVPIPPVRPPQPVAVPPPRMPIPVDTFKPASQTQEPVIKKLKLKHDSGSSSPGLTLSAPSVSSPSLTSSGSEKMLASSVAGKKCMKILKKLQNNQFGKIFLTPVDPVALNIPTYFSVIKHPMDLRTINKKLDRGHYVDHNSFKADVDLMLNNCFVFNVPGDWVYNQGKGLEAVFQKEWREVDWDILPIPGVVRPVGPTIEKTLAKLMAHQSAFIFLEPVDPAILPDYYMRIKNPIDLGTMTDKLRRGEYQTLEAFERDMKLMLSNCYSYNQKESLGHNSGLALEKFFKQIFRK